MASLTDVFLALNDLERDGVVHRYAIAGAMAFLFYTEPVRTYDLDVFIFLPQQEGALVLMGPLYSELQKRGYLFDAEHVLMHDTPVQFLPAYNPLAVEAVQQAITHDYNGVQVRVISAEHLVALALQAGGTHRRIRAQALLEDDTLNAPRLKAILAAHSIEQDAIGNTDG